jgi:hypothetical protein
MSGRYLSPLSGPPLDGAILVLRPCGATRSRFKRGNKSVTFSYHQIPHLDALNIAYIAPNGKAYIAMFKWELPGTSKTTFRTRTPTASGVSTQLRIGSARTNSRTIFALMVKAARSIFATRAGLMGLALTLLCACNEPCPSTEITTAVYYSSDTFSFGSEGQKRRWISNPRLDRFLKRTVASDGVGSLSRKHGLLCVPRPTSDGCTDCYSCTGTVAAEEIDLTRSMIATGCFASGTVAIRAEIGPGDAATSMTY